MTVTTFDRFFLWRQSCKPFTDIECLVTSNGPVQVTDSITKRPEYGIQLNVTTRDYYWLQNILMFYSDPPLTVWVGYVLSPKGDKIHYATDRLDFALDPLGSYRCNLGMTRDGSSTYRTVQVFDGTGKIVFNPPEKELYINLDKDLIDASLDNVGLGDCSEATFRSADFDIQCFMHSSVDGDVVNDIMCDGSNELQAYNLPAPSICGRFPRTTCENGNLLYELQSASTSSAFLKAHPA